MGKSRVCACCGLGDKLTHEHVFPDCFQKTFEPITPTKPPDGKKAILSPLEIQDVCARCNNGLLSRLDDSLCDFNDLYFSKIVRPGDRIRFQYDWDFLLRMLLYTHAVPAALREANSRVVRLVLPARLA